MEINTKVKNKFTLVMFLLLKVRKVLNFTDLNFMSSVPLKRHLPLLYVQHIYVFIYRNWRNADTIALIVQF